MSSAIVSKRNGRSTSAVRPWPCMSAVITQWSSASTGRLSPNMSPVPKPPCSMISGVPPFAAPCSW